MLPIRLGAPPGRKRTKRLILEMRAETLKKGKSIVHDLKARADQQPFVTSEVCRPPLLGAVPGRQLRAWSARVQKGEGERDDLKREKRSRGYAPSRSKRSPRIREVQQDVAHEDEVKLTKLLRTHVIDVHIHPLNMQSQCGARDVKGSPCSTGAASSVYARVAAAVILPVLLGRVIKIDAPHLSTAAGHLEREQSIRGCQIEAPLPGQRLRERELVEDPPVVVKALSDDSAGKFKRVVPLESFDRRLQVRHILPVHGHESDSMGRPSHWGQ